MTNPTVRKGSGTPVKIIPISREKLNAILSESGGSITRICGNEKNAVLFTPQAFDELKAITHFEQFHPDNAMECQYLLYGYYFVHEDKSFTSVVTCVFPLPSVCRESDFTQRTSMEDKSCIHQIRMQEQYLKSYSRSHNRDLKRNVPLNPLVKHFGAPYDMGEGHTHPSLCVFWSHTDRSNVHARGNEPYINIVIDPHKCPTEVLAGMGSNLSPCRVEFMEWNAPEKAAEAPAQPSPSPDLKFFARHLRTTIVIGSAILGLTHVVAALFV